MFVCMWTDVNVNPICNKFVKKSLKRAKRVKEIFPYFLAHDIRYVKYADIKILSILFHISCKEEVGKLEKHRETLSNFKHLTYFKSCCL